MVMFVSTARWMSKQFADVPWFDEGGGLPTSACFGLGAEKERKFAE